MTVLSIIALLGAALLYGDGIITPAISVLAAVEVSSDIASGHATLGDSCDRSVIILALFMVQRHGTARIGVSFGPIMVVWFTTLAVMGLIHWSSILEDPACVFAALRGMLPDSRGTGSLAHHGDDSCCA